MFFFAAAILAQSLFLPVMHLSHRFPYLLLLSLLTFHNLRAQLPADSPRATATRPDSALRHHRHAAQDSARRLFKADSMARAVPAGIPRKDSLLPHADTSGKGISLPLLKSRPGYRGVLKMNPWFNFFADPVFRDQEPREIQGKEDLFYLFAAILLAFALIKILFARYLNNLLALVFRASLKQKQIREQLLQTPLPSLLLNGLFVLVSGIYISFLLQHFQAGGGRNFWVLLAYSSATVAAIYAGKFLALKFTGWVFNMKEAADTYLFLVFLVNKILGIFLIPILILMAFGDPGWWDSLATISYIMVGGFFIYRYLVSFAPVRREAKVSQFHFFVYLCAFEVAPLLLIYKVLLKFL
jgi:hypothetical protein